MEVEETFGGVGKRLLSESQPFAWLLGVIVLFSVILLYYVRLKDFIESVEKIPGPRQGPLTCMLVALIPVVFNRIIDTNVLFFQTLCAYTKLYGSTGIWRFWSFLRPIVILTRPETIEVILSSNTLIDKSVEYYFVRPWLKAGLVTSWGSKWKSRRKLCTSAFHFRILEDFLPVFEEQSRILIEKLRNTKSKPLDIVPQMTLCTLDIICETAMGKTIGAQRNADSPYLRGLHVVCQTFIARIVRPWLWPDRIFFRTPVGKNFQKCIDDMSDFVQKVILERKNEILEANGGKPPDAYDEGGYFGKRKRQAFLDLLLYHHLRDSSLSLKDIEEEVDSFMFAVRTGTYSPDQGHDTTAVGISWILYLLGLYPQVQQKAYDEMYNIFGDDVDRPVTIEDLKEMKYMECVLKETQRIYPSVPFVGRKLREDVMIDGYRIPKRSTCLVFSYHMHQNPEYYPDPERFDPDRFLPENCVGRHPFSYVPFSAGPRNCIGQKFAFMEEKLLMANILRNFVVKSLDSRDKIQVTMEMVMRSKYGLNLTFTPRTSSANYVGKLRSEG